MKAKLGDQDAINAILNKYERMVFHIANRKMAKIRDVCKNKEFNLIDELEVHQGGRKGIRNAIQNYDWSVAFTTFLHPCIKNALSTVVKRGFLRRYEIVDNARSLDRLLVEGKPKTLGDKIPVENKYSETGFIEVVSVAFEEIKKWKWKEKKKDIFRQRLLAFELNLEEVGELCNSTRQRVHQIQKEGFAKLRKSKVIQEIFEVQCRSV